MKYIFYEKENDITGRVSLIYNESPPEEVLAIGNYFKVNNIPGAENIIGKTHILYCNPETKELWYEYEDRELTEQEKIQELENALLEMSTMQAIKDIENEQAIMELTTMVSTMLGGI